MKKYQLCTIVIIMMLVGVQFGANAQNKTATVNVSLTLSEIMSLKVNPTAQVAEFNFDSPEKYLNGITLPQSKALTVTSTSAYKVTVKAGKLNFDQVGGANTGAKTIPVSVLSVSAAIPGSKLPANPVIMTTSDQIIASDDVTAQTDYDLVYKIMPASSLLSADKKAKYTTVLTYTVTNQ